jgi:membrane protein implicated in regulation of membrane protease activity
MNRAFLIIIAPALFVALLYLGMGTRFRVPLTAGVALLAVATVAYLLTARLRRGKGLPQGDRQA